MNPTVRSTIRDDVLAGYQDPAPDLALRVLRSIPSRNDQPETRSGGRLILQTVGVVAAALVVGLAVVGVRAARGDLALPTELPFGIGGLHPPAAGYSIVDAQFLSADTAWIVAQLGEHNGPTVLTNTTDGGKTWHEQFRIPDGSGIGSFRFWNTRDGELTEIVPSTLQGGNQVLQSLSPTKTPGAPGSSNAVPRLYRTHDGGTHWQLVDRPVDWAGNGAASFFLRELEGWRILPTTRGLTAGTVQHTTDGGADWSTIGDLPAGAWLGNLVFTDQQTGWLAASGSKSYAWDANGKPIPIAPPTALLYFTRDGGQTWAPIDLPLPAEAAANDVRLESPIFFGKQDGLLEFEIIPPPAPPWDTSRQPPGWGWMHSYVLQTYDGGRHWTDLVLTPGGLQQGGALFFDARHWLLSQGPDLKETFDAGKTWISRQVLAQGLEFNLAPWNYIDAKTIWSQVGANRLVRSTDGGAHWASVTPPTIK